MQKNENIKWEKNIHETRIITHHLFNIKYEKLSPIIKDIQSISQLIRFIKKHQISDLIFIKGNKSYSDEAWFYFNYRNMIDLYLRVNEYIETDYFIKVKYKIYKTQPRTEEFDVIMNFFYINRYSSELMIETILFKKVSINKKILDLINSELNLNFTYLSQAIKNKKEKSFSYSSTIVQNDFEFVTKALLNIKLIEIILNAKLKNIGKDSKNDNINNNFNNEENIKNKDSSIIHTNEKYQVKLKKKEIDDWITKNNISFKIETVKNSQNTMIIQYKVILDDIIDLNNKDNIITVYIRKITNNSSFILIKYVWNLLFTDKFILVITGFIEKSLNNIKKICKTAKEKSVIN